MIGELSNRRVICSIPDSRLNRGILFLELPAECGELLDIFEQKRFFTLMNNARDLSASEGATDLGSFVPGLVLAQLSKPQSQPPATALAAADLQREALTEPLLQAMERALADPENNFKTDGLLFNHAVYLFAKWRETKAYPLFVRWFNLPGEGAFDLGGDTLRSAGARLIASVSGGDVEPIKGVIANGDANPWCRAEAIEALAVLATWGQQSRSQVEEFCLTLARERLERKPGILWALFASLCLDAEMRTVLPEIRRASAEGLMAETPLNPVVVDKIEREPDGKQWDAFVQSSKPITDVAVETSWWAGYQGPPPEPVERVVGEPGATYIAPAQVGRNDPCPCGSGKKYKKCCAA